MIIETITTKGLSMLGNIIHSLMLGLFVANAPIGDSSLSIWAQYGLAGLVVAYTLWRDTRREERMSTQIKELNEAMSKLQSTTIKENTDALNELKNRPCLLRKAQ